MINHVPLISSYLPHHITYTTSVDMYGFPDQLPVEGAPDLECILTTSIRTDNGVTIENESERLSGFSVSRYDVSRSISSGSEITKSVTGPEHHPRHPLRASVPRSPQDNCPSRSTPGPCCHFLPPVAGGSGSCSSHSDTQTAAAYSTLMRTITHRQSFRDTQLALSRSSPDSWIRAAARNNVRASEEQMWKDEEELEKLRASISGEFCAVELQLAELPSEPRELRISVSDTVDGTLEDQSRDLPVPEVQGPFELDGRQIPSVPELQGSEDLPLPAEIDGQERLVSGLPGHEVSVQMSMVPPSAHRRISQNGRPGGVELDGREIWDQAQMFANDCRNPVELPS